MELAHIDRATAWIKWAGCKGADTSIFFADKEQDSFRERQKAAEAICKNCPVIVECATYALENNEAQGTWGGRSSWGSSSRAENSRYIERLKLRIEYDYLTLMTNTKRKRELIKDNLQRQKSLARPRGKAIYREK